MKKEPIKFKWGWMIFWSIILWPIGMVIYPCYVLNKLCKNSR